MSDIYWAAEEDTETVVNKVSGFLNAFSLNCESERSNISAIWSRNLRMYYQSVVSNDSLDSSLGSGGENGELIEMHVPVARADVRKLISIATRQRLNFKAQSESTDYLTKGATVVADALAQEYLVNHDFNDLRERALELAIVTGSSFILTQWDPSKQEPMFRILPCWMTTYNFNAESFEHLDWFVAHYFMNRYSLAEQYPDKRDEIINFKTDRTAINPWSINFGVLDYSEDDILVSEFYHRGTDALPQGRFIKFIGDQGLEDMENPFVDKNGYAEIPVAMVIPETIQPYLIGYPKLCDLLPLQEMTDHQFSVMASIFANLGTPAILNPRGSGMNASNMSGFKVISFSPQMGDGMRGIKPEILELCKLPPNLLDTIQLMEQFQQRLSNVSGALQGVLPPGVTAASAIATLSANAVEFIEPLSLSVHKALESTMMRALIQTSQFMEEGRVVESVGPQDVTATIQFKAEDLRGLKRVSLLTQNPLTLFAGGRQKIAEDYMKMNLIDSPEKYDSVMVYGSVKPIQEKRMTKESLTSYENQEFRSGRVVYALASDDHAYHISEHAMLMNDPEVRKRPEIIRMIDDHIQSHLELSRTVDVGLYAMIQTGKNIPPDQNTPTGLPDQQMLPPQGEVAMDQQGGTPDDMPNPLGGEVAQPAEPAQPGFDLGAQDAVL
jgi:hypothetical protein